MTTATMSSKGQITIPAEVRRALAVDTGDQIEFVEVAPGRFEIIAATQPVTALKGMFGKPARSVSIDAMNKAIAARWFGAMTGLDTNVLVRYLMQDNARQSPKANRLIESLDAEAPGFIPIVTIVELVWVLQSCYDLTRAQVSQALDALLRAKELRLDRPDLVAKALRAYSAGAADFADCLIERTAAGAGCDRTVTFAVGASESAGMRLIS